jgi:hypothetical protein
VRSQFTTPLKKKS